MFAHKPITVCLVCLCLCHLIGTVPTGSPVAATTTATAEIEIEPANDTTTVATIEITTVEPKPKCKPVVEVYSNCTNSCPANCEEPNREPCRNFCWEGCECAEGYVKNYKWECIARDECPKCGENEHYRTCGTGCEPTCDTYQNAPIYCSAHANCRRGCFCNFGFVRNLNQNGTCVPIDHCPIKCGENEYWEMAGKPCIRTADNPRPSCLFEPPQAACVCNTGFKRDATTNQCVPISPDVLHMKCAQNETFSYCGTECAQNCHDQNKRIMCPTICQRGCFCNEEYRRHSDGPCVLPEDCRASFTHSQPFEF